MRPAACLLLLLALAAGGCALDGGSSAAEAHLAGRVGTVGGAAPGRFRPEPRALIRLRRPGGAPLSVRADARGRFALELPPGRYRLSMAGRSATANGAFLPPRPARVVLAAGERRTLRLVISIK